MEPDVLARLNKTLASYQFEDISPRTRFFWKLRTGELSQINLTDIVNLLPFFMVCLVLWKTNDVIKKQRLENTVVSQAEFNRQYSERQTSN